ncbi:MAG: preprotein translocase subunit Sec61beta [Candidatus Aenigmarchaeota archaeon]|nr:preprotein translocase subunit Sec61beta [Candidatus Aenigmarchaeota archaeon]
MSKEEKRYMPQSTAGLIRYFDVEEQIKIKPEHVIFITVGFAALILMLKFFV